MRGRTWVRPITAAGLPCKKLIRGGGCIEVVQALVDAGADWTKKTQDGKTAMDIAKEEGRQEIALLFEQAGAS